MATDLQADPTTDVAFWSKIVEQRQEERVDFRTTGSVYPLGEAGTNPVSAPIKIWTVDVSTTGVLVRSYAKIDETCQRVLVRLIMPQLSDSLIEGTIVRSKQDIAKYFNGKEKESFLYGVQFTRLIKNSAVPEELLNAPLIVEESQTAPGESKLLPVVKTVEKLARDVESRIPFLSAIGLVVVYAALLFMF